MTTTSTKAAETRLLYWPGETLRIVTADLELLPVHLYSVLFPLREVEISGTVRDSQQYDLLVEFLTRGIAEGGLTSTERLARFFGLEPVLVQKVLAFLQAIGHIQQVQGAWSLTPLGLESRQDQKMYVQKKTKRKLYFEAFSSHPLPKGYYKLDVLSVAEALEAREKERYFYPLSADLYPWSPGVVSNLARQNDRDDYNLPYQIDQLSEEEMTLAYLPMHLVETRRFKAGALSAERYYAVVTRLRNASGERVRDAFFEQIVNRNQDLPRHLDVNTAADLAKYESLEAYLQEQLSRRKQEGELREISPGAWRMIPKPEVLLSSKGDLTVEKIGKPVFLDKGYCVQIWSDDPALRRQAALEQILDLLQHKQRRREKLSRQSLNELMRKLAIWLSIEPPGWNALYQRAQERNLVTFLEKVIQS
jgi:hypothetical protein